MNLSDLSRTARQGLTDFARQGCIILARRRGERGGWCVKPVSVWRLQSPAGIDKLVALLENGWRIVRR